MPNPENGSEDNTCGNCRRWIETRLSKSRAVFSTYPLRQCLFTSEIYAGDSLCEHPEAFKEVRNGTV